MHFIYTLIVAFVFSSAALAQSVEVNRDVLGDYTPPPMFGAPLTTPDSIASSSTPTLDKVDTSEKTNEAPPLTQPFISPPKPQKKPAFARSVIAKNRLNKVQAAPVEEVEVEKIIVTEAPDLEVKTPDVRDILASIDPDVDLPAERADLPAKERVLAEPLPLAGDIISFQYMPGETSLNADISDEVFESIFAKTKGRPNARIEIHGYALSTDEGGESIERRLSLARALNMREMLTDRRISSQIIDIKALGRHTTQKPIDRVDIVFVQ